MFGSNSLRKPFLIAFLVIFMASVVCLRTAFAATTVTIGKFENVTTDSVVSVPVVKTSGDDLLFGFDFLMLYDTTALFLIDVTPGELFYIPGSFEWEYFNSRSGSEGESTGLVRAVGVADINDGDHHSLENLIPDGTVLFTLNFVFGADPESNCSWNPIKFYWKECGDNALAINDMAGALGVSRFVYDWDGNEYSEISDYGYGIPGIYGVSDNCLTNESIVRMLDLYNGGVEVSCDTMVNLRGDINCNGLEYEIADFVVLSNYFLFGSMAFGDMGECSQYHSDVNADGTYLQLEDLIYLYRIIIGDAIPLVDEFDHETITVAAFQDIDAKIISMDYTGELAAVHLVFEGEIVPSVSINVPGIIWAYGYSENHTRILILPEVTSHKPHFVIDGPFLSYTGNGQLISVSAADYNDHIFNIQIDSSGNDLTLPYMIKIGMINVAAGGEAFSLPVSKTAGSEGIGGFDFLIGYDANILNITHVTPAIPFDIPGEYEWEYFTYRFETCDLPDTICTASLLRVIGMAETNNGSHHALRTEIPDETVIFSLEGEITADPTYNGLIIPVSFIWMECGDNAIAYGPVGEKLALSRHVYNIHGQDISNPETGFPSYDGASDVCFELGENSPERFIDFQNGGVKIGAGDNLRLVVSIDSVFARPGEKEIHLDVYMTNFRDTIPGFNMLIQLDNPDLVKFGKSPDDTTAIDITGSLIDNWEFVSYHTSDHAGYNIQIVALANATPPFANSIFPQENGLLLRLILHTSAEIPDLIENTTVGVLINAFPQWTGFSDLDGNLIGFVDDGYDPQLIAFYNGAITFGGEVAGDANGDGNLDVGDPVFIVNYVFRNGPEPASIISADANCDSDCDVGDAVYLIRHVFKSGPGPCGRK
ncbi:MAG: hypothetical protein V3V99_11560 [candidate division Zixibacteria bacterium]